MLELELDMVQKVATAVRVGEWPGQVAVRYGATKSEFKAWWEAGSEAIDAPPGTALTEHQRLCSELVRAVGVAESECESHWIKMCQASVRDKGLRGGWMAYMTLLERRFPDRWRKREMEKKGRDVFDPDSEMRRLSEVERGSEASDARRALGG